MWSEHENENGSEEDKERYTIDYIDKSKSKFSEDFQKKASLQNLKRSRYGTNNNKNVLQLLNNKISVKIAGLALEIIWAGQQLHSPARCPAQISAERQGDTGVFWGGIFIVTKSSYIPA